MRLTKIKLAGFKSFVDPTQISFPSNLTGVVGPNGCGKSNVIDAVRWVMGELSAKHLRGDNMADVVFNGSAARKPVGTASVELLFDNADGKIGGAYAGYSEISLRRQVSRDGTSAYFINGGRCRRKDITNLFLGTGLGSRSYAIIEQGMISRVIDARAEDMRAFVEEAAGISRYKERRKETELRVAETRENLERVQDLRDEVDKQIRHLQRQAATARRYQGLKDEERRLTAELLALRLRELDSGGQVHDAAVRERELAMQAELSAQRAAEAEIEKQRAVHGGHTESLQGVQGRYYEVGADISRLEQSIEHTRELRERQRTDLAQTHSTLTDLASHIARDGQQLALVQAEIVTLEPQLATAQQSESQAAAALETAEADVQEWQQRWEQHTQAQGAADQTTEVERARIEQLEAQLQRFATQAERLAAEHDSTGAPDGAQQLQELTRQEARARAASEDLARAHESALQEVQTLRSAAHQSEEALQAARSARETTRAEFTSLEALQAAALSDHAGKASAWLNTAGLAGRPRLAAALEVDPGWERAVETALGEYLEAVCVDELDASVGALGTLDAGRVTLVESRETARGTQGATLAARVRGPVAVLERLSGVLTTESLQEALRGRAILAAGESRITRDGEWVGRNWLRVSRAAEQRGGVIEREQRLKSLRVAVAAAESQATQREAELGAARAQLTQAESGRDAAQAGIHHAHRTHADLLAALEAGRARAEGAQARRLQLQQDAHEVTRDHAATHEALTRARAELARGVADAQALLGARAALESAREARRGALLEARSHSQAAQLLARDLHVRAEGRRSTASSVAVGVARMAEQHEQLTRRRGELEQELAEGDAPILAARARLDATLALRLTVEAELAAARSALEDAESELRGLDETRLAALQRVNSAREGLDAARLAAQETHVRRAALAEQFAETRCELPEVLARLAPEAQVPVWEETLSSTRADIEKLGQVNLAAIDELKDHTTRKEYLDRQFADVSSALDTLDEAMRRIDKETRSRFEDTFDRINLGLREKFPRLFGGGSAFLELAGDDKLTAGVTVMARPPGKKISTIHLLSGGEKALTAVALVFAIFDLNPAPFCLLDEVDAPLDEHNVGRFCDIVREMSQRVQFVFITHNKTTMELASQLIGVTMNEPGVSRLVTVDVDAALRMAAV
ncbi:MAG: chromosome segregation protein SMC [Steroidobacterales bacterium]|jgi:chromosome segregation protein